MTEAPNGCDGGAGPHAGEVPWTGDDALLTELALADLREGPAPDSVPIDRVVQGPAGFLPEWYMPPSRARITGRWGRIAVLGLVCAFVLIEALGLCTTFGQMPLHWLGH